MASTYSGNLRVEKMGSGDQSGTWGDTTNTNFELFEDAISGYVAVAHGDGTTTLSANDGAADEARNAVVEITGAITAARNVVVPTAEKVYLVKNSTTGGFAVTFKTSAGTGVAVPMGHSRWVYCDGTNVVDGIIDGVTRTTTAFSPTTTDALALGTTSIMWSDLFLASGSVINWNNGDVTLTHSANALAWAGATGGYSFDALLKPASSDGAALGSASVMWSDIFLAAGAVINFNNGDVTLTHDTDVLTFGGGAVAFADNELRRPTLLDYSEKVNAIGSAGGTRTVNFESGNVQSVTVATSTNTFAFSNPPPTGTCGSVTLIITNGGSQTVNWPAAVKWPGGASGKPTLTTAGVDILSFITIDAGTTIYGFRGGLNFS